MQTNTSNLPSTHPVRSLMGLARQIALPHEFAPERFPSFPALERTAVMSFNSPASLNLPASTAVKMMVARQAAYPVWADVTNTSPWSYTVGYETVGSLSSSTTDSVPLTFEANINTWSTGNLTANRSFLGVAGSSGNRSYSIMAVDQDCGSCPFTYVPAGASLNIVVVTRATTIPAGNTSAMLDYDVWSSPGQANTFKGSSISILGGNTGAVLNTTFSENSWIRPRSLQVVAAGAAGAAVAPAYLVFIQVSPTYRDWETDRKSTRLNSSHRL